MSTFEAFSVGGLRPFGGDDFPCALLCCRGEFGDGDAGVAAAETFGFERASVDTVFDRADGSSLRVGDLLVGQEDVFGVGCHWSGVALVFLVTLVTKFTQSDYSKLLFLVKIA